MALAGSYLGSSFSMMVSDTVLKHMMMVVLPIVAFYVLRNKNMGAETEQQALPGQGYALYQYGGSLCDRYV